MKLWKITIEEDFQPVLVVAETEALAIEKFNNEMAEMSEPRNLSVLYTLESIEEVPSGVHFCFLD